VTRWVDLTRCGLSQTEPSTLEYSLPVPGDVAIELYDLAGRRIATVEHASESAGWHLVAWPTSHLARGLYFCRLHAGSVTVTRPVLVLE
jgi:hypothetical protein